MIHTDKFTNNFTDGETVPINILRYSEDNNNRSVITRTPTTARMCVVGDRVTGLCLQPGMGLFHLGLDSHAIEHLFPLTTHVWGSEGFHEAHEVVGTVFWPIGGDQKWLMNAEVWADVVRNQVLEELTLKVNKTAAKLARMTTVLNKKRARLAALESAPAVD